MFGLALSWSGMTSPDVLRDGLLFRDPYLMLFFASALATAFVGLRRAEGAAGARAADRRAGAWTTVRPQRAARRRQRAVRRGWAVADACPGPIAAQLGQGVPWSLATAAGLVLGVWLFLRRAGTVAAHDAVATSRRHADGRGAPTVADLDRSLGLLRVRDRAARARAHGGRAALGTGGEDLLVLTERAGRAAGARHAGLFHFALLVPERADLARWLAHAARERVPLTGMSDHFVSEAIYLERPRRARDRDLLGPAARGLGGPGRPAHDDEPLDVARPARATVDERPSTGSPPGRSWATSTCACADDPGHARFYADVLGFGLMAALGAQAAFLSAGGYHHHIGANTWESAGAPPAPEGTARLERTTIVLPDAAARDRLDRAGRRAGFVPATRDGAVGSTTRRGNPVALQLARVAPQRRAARPRARV